MTENKEKVLQLTKDIVVAALSKESSLLSGQPDAVIKNITQLFAAVYTAVNAKSI